MATKSSRKATAAVPSSWKSTRPRIPYGAAQDRLAELRCLRGHYPRGLYPAGRVLGLCRRHPAIALRFHRGGIRHRLPDGERRCHRFPRLARGQPIRPHEARRVPRRSRIRHIELGCHAVLRRRRCRPDVLVCDRVVLLLRVTAFRCRSAHTRGCRVGIDLRSVSLGLHGMGFLLPAGCRDRLPVLRS